MKYLRPHAWLVAAAFFCAAVSSVGQILTPVVIGEAVNCTALGADGVDFVKLTAYICALAVIIAAVMLFQ